MVRSLFLVAVAAAVGWAMPSMAQARSRANDTAAAVEGTFQLIEHRVAGMVPATKSSDAPSPPAEPANTGVRFRDRDAFLGFIRAAEARHALPQGLLDALVAVESAYRPGAISRVGAMGLAQLMPATARALGVRDPFDPRANIDGGARFLRMMLDRFGSVTLALAAYNAGPGAVARAGGIPANTETPAYVRKVLGLWRAGRL